MTISALKLPALSFTPEAFVLNGPKLLGRHVAGNSFLRAAVNAAESGYDEANRLCAYTPSRRSAAIFSELVKKQSPSVVPVWIPADRIDLLSYQKALFLPGPGIGDAARFRLRANPAAWSITGVTHTLCSHRAMDGLVDLLNAPIMPWDALVCSTAVAKAAISKLFDLQAQYLDWRFGVKSFIAPQLPVIPFGIHTEDFEFSSGDREIAREGLKIQPNELVVLFAGRLSFHAKAHPYPMFLALEKTAQVTGQPLHLLLCGQFPNDSVKGAFLAGARKYCPTVRVQWVDGSVADAYRRAWAGSDLFVSLSDNLQETFGITPIEAMASGLPVIVSDWDGYRETVLHGETGYRIPTWMTPPDHGKALAMAYESGTVDYDRYIGLACLDVAVDIGELTRRLCELVCSREKRLELGEAGRKRAKETFDWKVVMKQYVDLWSHLEASRFEAQNEGSALFKNAPACAPSRHDPYLVFSSFPTHLLSRYTKVALCVEQAQIDISFSALRADPLFSYANDWLPSDSDVDRALNFLKAEGEVVSLEKLATSLSLTLDHIMKLVAILAKLGLVDLFNSEFSDDLKLNAVGN
mgnify:FL=1